MREDTVSLVSYNRPPDLSVVSDWDSRFEFLGMRNLNNLMASRYHSTVPHSKKVLGLNPKEARGFSVESLSTYTDALLSTLKWPEVGVLLIGVPLEVAVAKGLLYSILLETTGTSLVVASK